AAFAAAAPRRERDQAWARAACERRALDRQRIARRRAARAVRARHRRRLVRGGQRRHALRPDAGARAAGDAVRRRRDTRIETRRRRARRHTGGHSNAREPAMNATALIAEDEPLLAANLQAELAQLWPELRIVASVGHGEAAVERALALQPDLLFLDIRMPGMSGLDAAQALAEDWPDNGKPFPLIAFVTAYDQYALQAFERAAIDYVLKPVQPQRLAQTCTRLQSALRQRDPLTAAPSLAAAIEQLRGLVGTGGLGASSAAS